MYVPGRRSAARVSGIAATLRTPPRANVVRHLLLKLGRITSQPWGWAHCTKQVLGTLRGNTEIIIKGNIEDRATRALFF